MSCRNIIGWALHHLTPGPAVYTSTSGHDPLACGHRLLAVSPTRSPWWVVPKRKWLLFVQTCRPVQAMWPRPAARCGGWPPSKSGPHWRRGRAQGPQGGEIISPKTWSMRQGVLCLVCLPGSAGVPSAFSWEAWRVRRRGCWTRGNRKLWEPTGVPTACGSFQFLTFSC